jgi:hypothetical protein
MRGKPSWVTSSLDRPADPDTKWASPARTRTINVTDPDRRVIKDGRRSVRGYNAQAAVTEDQIVVCSRGDYRRTRLGRLRRHGRRRPYRVR